MLKSSLLEILRTFSKQELIKFEDFVRSPYFNKKENVTKLFLYVKKYAPDFTDDKLSKEYAWINLFQGEEYNYGIMKNVIFDLNKLVEKYVILKKFEENKLTETRYLLEYLGEKNLTKLFFSKYDNMEKTFNRFSIGLNQYYGLKLDLMILKSNILVNTKLSHTTNNISSLYLTVNFLINAFKVYQNLVVANNGLNINFDNNPVAYLLRQISKESFEDILENTNKVSETDYLYLKIYYKMYCMFHDTGGESYLYFKNLLFNNLEALSPKEQRDLHFCLISGNVLVVNPEINTSLEKLSVFDSMISLNIITESHGSMSEHIFIRYVSLAFHELDIERINKFAEKYIVKLAEDIRDNTQKYVKSLNLFIENKYEDSLNVITQIDPNYFTMKVHLRYYKAICIYKINDYELFLSEYDSVKHFVKNNDKLNSLQKSRLEKYYYFINHLFKLRENFNEYDLLIFKKEAGELYRNEYNWISMELINLENKFMNG